MSAAILFVDDDQLILRSIGRIFADTELPLIYAADPLQALEYFQAREIAVVVSDHQMPQMLGIDFLNRVRGLAPQAIRILMTAYADLPTALAAINRGEVFRFLVKPWNNEELLHTVHQAANRYRTLQALHREDEAILCSLAQAIELKDPYTRGHCDRVATYAQQLACRLGFSEQAQKEVRCGSWLHDCGKIGVPEVILNHNGVLSGTDFDTIKKHPQWGAEVARQAQLPEAVVNIILYHHERFDGSGYPYGLKGANIPLEARVVAVADVYDAITSDRPYRKAYGMPKALAVMESLKGATLDPELTALFTATFQGDAAPPGEAGKE